MELTIDVLVSTEELGSAPFNERVGHDLGLAGLTTASFE